MTVCDPRYCIYAILGSIANNAVYGLRIHCCIGTQECSVICTATLSTPPTHSTGQLHTSTANDITALGTILLPGKHTEQELCQELCASFSVYIT